jgi:hypothetical protein
VDKTASVGSHACAVVQVPAPPTAHQGRREFHARAPTRQLKAPLACATSCPSAARGQGTPPTFCVSALIVAALAFRGTAWAGSRIPARSRAACVGRRHSYGHWASRLRSVAKADLETGSSGCVLLPKIPSAPSAASVIGDFCERSPRFGRPAPSRAVSVTADGADGADANAGFRGAHRRFRIYWRRPGGPGAI